MQKVYDRQKLVYNIDPTKAGHSNDISGLVAGEKATATFTTQGYDVGTYVYGSTETGMGIDYSGLTFEGEANSSNYSVTVASGVIMGIAKATAKVVVSGKSKVYDGTSFDYPISSDVLGDFEGVAIGDKLTGVASTGANINAGDYSYANGTVTTMVQAGEGTNIKNYNIINNATLSITKKDISNEEVGPIVVNCDPYPEYNGMSQRPDGQAEFYVHYQPAGKPEIIMGNNADYIVTGETGKDATEKEAYTLTITGTGTNYIGTKKIKWGIAPRPIVVNPHKSDFDYTGEAVEYDYSSNVAGDISYAGTKGGSVGVVPGELVIGKLVTSDSIPGIYNVTGLGDDVVGIVFTTESPAEAAHAGNGATNMSNYLVTYDPELTIDYVSIASDEIV